MGQSLFHAAFKRLDIGLAFVAVSFFNRLSAIFLTTANFRQPACHVLRCPSSRKTISGVRCSEFSTPPVIFNVHRLK